MEVTLDFYCERYSEFVLACDDKDSNIWTIQQPLNGIDSVNCALVISTRIQQHHFSFTPLMLVIDHVVKVIQRVALVIHRFHCRTSAINSAILIQPRPAKILGHELVAGNLMN